MDALSAIALLPVDVSTHNPAQSLCLDTVAAVGVGAAHNARALLLWLDNLAANREMLVYLPRFTFHTRSAAALPRPANRFGIAAH
jgi:hypothetical protein